MITTPAGTSMDLDEAAAFLGLHKNTLQERAKAGEIPGAKIGKGWRFLAERLVEYLKSKEKVKECLSTSQAEAHTGGSISLTRTGMDALEKAQEKQRKRRLNESTTKRRRSSGKQKSRVVNFPTPSPRGQS